MQAAGADDKPKLSQEEIDVKLHPMGVVCFCFSPDATMIAVSVKEENVVNIYQINQELHKPRNFKLLHTLKEHNLPISGVDWNVRNQIITVSYDRNAIVWNFNARENKWKTDLVIIQDQARAILDVNWSASGNKFVLGTGAHRVFVGYYEDKNKWWHSKRIANFASSVLAVRFHPSERVVATGSADHTVKLISAYIEGVDAKAGAGIFGNIVSAGEILWELDDAGGWVEGLSFRPDGTSLAFVCHDGSIQYVDFDASGAFTPLKTKYVDELPFRAIAYHPTQKNDIIAAGSQRIAFHYTRDDREILKCKGKIENSIGYPAGIKKIKSNLEQKVSMFNQMGTKQATVTNEKNFHSNPITCMRLLNATTLATSDIHGNLFFWKI